MDKEIIIKRVRELRRDPLSDKEEQKLLSLADKTVKAPRPVVAENVLVTKLQALIKEGSSVSMGDLEKEIRKAGFGLLGKDILHENGYVTHGGRVTKKLRMSNSDVWVKRGDSLSAVPPTEELFEEYVKGSIQILDVDLEREYAAAYPPEIRKRDLLLEELKQMDRLEFKVITNLELEQKVIARFQTGTAYHVMVEKDLIDFWENTLPKIKIEEVSIDTDPEVLSLIKRYLETF